MNKFRCSSQLCCAVLVFLLSSCGGGEEKKSSTETTTDTMATTEVIPATPVSTISNVPQHMMVVRHKVADFAKWKTSYDAHDSMRIVNGLHNYVIGRSMPDSNMLLVAVKADDMAKARAFAKNPSLKQAMQKGGVTGTPKVMFFTTTFQDTARISSNVRSMTLFTVKDRDTWQKSFNDGKQERIDNGIVERVVGYDADNDKKIVLVTAIMDSAKANAYWKSDALKKRREAGGVIGEPERFVFNVVQRY